jgi:hypothetical protein
MSARLVATPGLTGWAQVNGGRNVTALDKTALNLWYIKHASLLLDIKIAFRTILVLFGNEDANHSAISAAWRDINKAGQNQPGKRNDAAEVISYAACRSQGLPDRPAFYDAAE